MVGGGKPEEKGEDGGFHSEGGEEQHGGGIDEEGVFRLGKLEGNVRHVEGAELSVDQADSRKEKDGGKEVDDEVFHPAL